MNADFVGFRCRQFVRPGWIAVMTRLGRSGASGLAAVVLALLCPAASSSAQSISGPMVGHTTPNTSRLWLYAPADAAPEVRWWIDGDDAGVEATATMTAEPADAPGNVFRHQFTNLRAGTTYAYHVTGEDIHQRGTFTTAPAPEAAGHRFSYVVTSCMNVRQWPEQPAWDRVLAEKPAFHLMIGDNVYADSTVPAVLWQWHLEQRAVPGFARLLATTPTWASWDDHDFGPNDSHKNTPGKERSLATFKQVFANSSYGTSNTPGVFHSFAWGDVEFFVLDGRYYRDDEHRPVPPGADRKTQFGDAQLQWLLDGLRASDATFKVVASGYDVMGSRYPGEIKVIADLIKRSGATGVFFHAGDIHRNEYKRQEHGAGYPIIQITSSGVARSPKRPFAMIDVDTTLDDPTVTARFFEEEELVMVHTIKLSELTPEGGPSNDE